MNFTWSLALIIDQGFHSVKFENIEFFKVKDAY